MFQFRELLPVEGEKKSKMKIAVMLAIILVTSSFSLAAVASGNCVADYLIHAELQCEARDQLKEIRRALSDMLVLAPKELLKKRYCDYQMHHNQWTAVEILERYFVPVDRVFIDPKCFASSVRSVAAQNAIKRILNSKAVNDPGGGLH
jgi:hypothetical protein